MPHVPVFHHVTGEWRSRWRGHIHGYAVIVSLPAGVVLTLLASGPLATSASAIYAASLVALFGTSAAYHLFARSARLQHVMQRADHCMVYVLIAGTYTPVCLLALPRALGITMLAIVWGVAILGMVLKAMWKARKFATSLYLVLGWIVVAVVPWVYERAGGAALALYAVGGVVFTAGSVMFLRRFPRLRPESFGFHEVWHVMTVAAVVCQFAATALLLRR